MRQGRMSILRVLLISLAVLAVSIATLSPRVQGGDQGRTRTETFDRDPSWEGRNNRSARDQQPVMIRQNFGFSNTGHAGGRAGEIGGFITGAGEVAYYGKPIPPASFDDHLTASGTIVCADGGSHILLGFFNADTCNEWRTPNTISIRINGRGEHFYAYVEYCTQTWRAGGDNPQPFPRKDENGLIGYASGRQVHKWSLTYDPDGNNGGGTVTATIDGDTAICNLDPGHKADGAVFNRFGLMNVIKSADGGAEIYLDDLTINGQEEHFDEDPNWDAKNNRNTYPSRLVRPRFDFGFSDTNHAGGASKGELGGTVFRGDCREPLRMACYGDVIGPLTLDKPIKASGKIAMRRGVSDSTTFFGFYNAQESMRSNPSQRSGIPASVLGIHIEGPSREGFFVYPVYRTMDGDGAYPDVRLFPRIHPDGKSHDWSLQYIPATPGGKGRITISLDDDSATFDLDEDLTGSDTSFDRFGIVTSWIDGNSQDVYFDDLTYTVSQ